MKHCNPWLVISVISVLGSAKADASPPEFKSIPSSVISIGQPQTNENSTHALPTAIEPWRDARRPSTNTASPPAAFTAPPPHAQEPSESAPQTSPPASRPSPRRVRTKPVDAMSGALAQANRAFQEQRYAQVLELLNPFEAQLFRQRELGAARLQGWAAWHVGNSPLAHRWFTRAANWSNLPEDMANVVRTDLTLHNYSAALEMLRRMPQDETWRELRVQAHQAYAIHLFQTNDYPQTIRQLDALGTLRPLDAGEMEILGWSHYKLAQYDHARRAFEQSLHLQPSQGAAEGLIFSLNAQNQLSEVFRISDALGQDTPLARLTADPIARERLLRQPLNPRVMVDASARLMPTPYQPEAQPSYARTALYTKNNETPFDQGNFRTHGLRLEGLASGDRYRLRVDARVFNADDHQQRVDGLRDVYMQGRYYSPEGQEWTLGLGSTPQGGILDPTWRGELGLGWLESEQGGRIRLARRNVEQSVLSTSGSVQPASADSPKIVWGQVMREGLELEGYRTLGSWKAEGSLGLAQLTGVGVADNSMFELYANILHPTPTLLDGLALGPMLYASGYQKNLSPFTPGNGGYYSPEKMLRLAAMARYQTVAQGDHGFNMRLDASLGWQTSNDAAASPDPLAADARYTLGASQNSGLAATLELDMHYSVNKYWRYGLLFAGQKSPDYSFLSSQIYLMYTW